MGEPTEFTRRSSGAATLRSSALVLVFAENNEAQGSARPGAEGRGMGVGVVGEFKNRINAGTRIQRDETAYTSVVPTNRVHQGAEKKGRTLVVQGKYKEITFQCVFSRFCVFGECYSISVLLRCCL